LASRHPVLVSIVSLSLAFASGTTWFPLLPFVAAIVAILHWSILRTHIINGNRKLIAAIVLVGLTISIIVFPQLQHLVTENRSFLQKQGGTRVASDALVFIWLAIVFIATGTSFNRKKEKKFIGGGLFLVSIIVLVLSNLYLYLSGYFDNVDSPGYGASKYFLTTISFSLPVLIIVIIHFNKRLDLIRSIALGLVLLFGIVVSQPDARSVAVSVFASNQPAPADPSRQSAVSAIREALEQKPDQIFCTADYGYPALGEEIQMDSYFCTRWAQSIIGDETGGEWRFVPLNRIPLETLLPVKEAFASKKVVMIRFTDPGRPLLKKDTWWVDYVAESWQIVNVKTGQ